MNLQQRMIYLQSWWVASEFFRRHPDHDLIETHPGGGQYDCLTILGPGKLEQVHIDLNRAGRMHIHSGMAPRFNRTEWGIRHPVEWSTESEQADRRMIPRFIEAAVGVPAPAQTPMTTPKTLTFRVIYHLLLFAVNEAMDWDVHNSVLDSSGMVGRSSPDYFAEIASARAAIVHYATEAQQKYTFWAVQRDYRCLALLQENGMLHRPEAEPVDVMKIYNAEHRDILSASLKVRQLIVAQAQPFPGCAPQR